MKNWRASRTALVVVRALLIAAIGLTLFVGYGLIDNAWYRVLAVRGGSMQPTISPGDLIVITRPPDDVEEGMILTLQVDGAVVTHRVVAVRHDGTFVTQGDANDSRDDFSANQVRIVGVYRFMIPWLGNLVDLFVGSGAWASTSGDVGVELASGTWIDAAEPIAVDTEREQITWATPAPTPSATVAPTISPSAESIADATSAPEPSEIPPSVDPTPSAEPTSTPGTPAVSPSATPEPQPSASPDPTPGPTP